MGDGAENAGMKRDTRFKPGNKFGRGRPRKAPDAVLDMLGELSDKTTEEKIAALESLVGKWLAKAAGDRDRASLVREATALFRLGAELRREIRVAGTADINILIVERDRAVGELASREKSWDAEMSAVVGALAGHPEARRAVMGALGRVRAIAEHGDRPGYPIMALPAPAEAEAAASVQEDTPAEGAMARPGGDAADQPGAAGLLPVEQEPAGERSVPPVPVERRGPQGQNLPPGWTIGPQGQQLPPGVTIESGRPRPRGVGGTPGYGDEFPG